MYLNLNGYSYYVDRLENELNRSYFLRCWYVVNYNQKILTNIKNFKIRKIIC